jgi:SAM-dependent methyltransferase
MSDGNELWRPAWPQLPDLLVCPDCRRRLTLDCTAFRCSGCGHNFPVVGGVPRFVSKAQYASSFGFQWLKHARTQLDGANSRNSEEFFRSRLGLSPEEISGKLVLDVGCGMGRFAEVASRFGARVVGVDLSRAVEAAHANLASRGNVQVMQGDVFHLPFAEESFDFIYSIGVLHHTPDCEAAFRCLPRLLKPGGKISIWLYSGYERHMYYMSELYRKLTTRMPNQLLYGICHAAAPLHYLHYSAAKLRLKPLAYLLQFFLPMSHHPDWRWRVLDTFDWYSPKYQSKHTYEEVFRWFEAEGLCNNRVLSYPISVQGQKPLPVRGSAGK